MFLVSLLRNEKKTATLVDHEMARPANLLRQQQQQHWKQHLSKDCVAGLTVGLMVVPQSMSYARLAGLPVEFGLYSALMPLVAYAVFGTSRQLAVGPVALLSLLLHQGLTALLQQQQVCHAPGLPNGLQ